MLIELSIISILSPIVRMGLEEWRAIKGVLKEEDENERRVLKRGW